jgi:hypothetical protein
MKKIAVLRYMIIFDPSETWSNGFQFEAQFADFFAAHGFEAQIIAPAGGSGDRVISIERVFSSERIAKELKQTDGKSNTVNQIKQVQQKTAPKDFKQFKNPRHFNTTPPKTTYQQGRTNRMKVRI